MDNPDKVREFGAEGTTLEKQAGPHGPRTPARGLATLALLKSNFDLGRDHIDMFMPFVLDAIGCLSSNDFATDDVATEIRGRHGLVIPPHTLQIILHRATKKHAIRREGGRYFRESGFDVPIDVGDKRRQLEAEHVDIAKSLVAFADESGLNGLSEDDALALMFQFLADNHVSMVLDATSGATSIEVDDRRTTPLNRNEIRIIARFVLDRYHNDPHIGTCLQNMLEGFILQNALFLRDISAAQRRFSNLTVFLDTGMIIEAIGLEGETAATATREALKLLRDRGAHLAVFQKTLDEVTRILMVYETHLATADGIASLFPTAVTRYVVTNYMSPSDIRQIISLLPRQVRDLAISIKEFPEREPRYTLGEEDLTQRIMRPTDTALTPRVTHDVDCIAAVVTLRRGNVVQSLDNARAVFATRTGLLVKNTRKWFVAEGQEGMSPVIHHIALSSAAWLKRPASAPNLQLNQLVALCAAAAAPSKRLWGSFVSHLKKLREDGTITSDEIVAVIADRMIDTLLWEIDADIEPDSETMDEIIQRVKSDYRRAGEARFNKSKVQFQEQLGSARMAIKDAETQGVQEAERRRRLELNVIGKSRKWANILSWTIFVPTAFILVVGSTALVERFLPSDNWVLRLAGILFTFFAWLAAIGALVTGGNLSEWRIRLERLMERRFRRSFGLESG